MVPPHPGAIVREEILDELGLTASEAATVLEVRRAILSELIDANPALSEEMALRIEKPSGEIAFKPYRPPAPELR